MCDMNNHNEYICVCIYTCTQGFPGGSDGKESACNGYSGLISFRMDWLDLLAVQGTLKSLLQHHSSKPYVGVFPILFNIVDVLLGGLHLGVWGDLSSLTSCGNES